MRARFPFVLLLLATACGDDNKCEDRTYSPESLTAVTCASSGSGLALSLSASVCWGAPDTCTFAVEGSAVTFSLVKEFCDDGTTQSTGCADPSTFECQGAVLAPGTYSLGQTTSSLTVAADGSCSFVP